MKITEQSSVRFAAHDRMPWKFVKGITLLIFGVAEGVIVFFSGSFPPTDNGFRLILFFSVLLIAFGIYCLFRATPISFIADKTSGTLTYSKWGFFSRQIEVYQIADITRVETKKKI